MEPKESFIINDTTKEVVIIHKQALSESCCPNLSIKGAIHAPREWLIKKYKVGCENEYNPKSVGSTPITKDSHIIVNRDEKSITLFQNVSDPYTTRKVEGSLKFTKAYEAWEINSMKYRSNKNLAEFIKMNRSCFESREVADKLVYNLLNLKVKVDKERESSTDNKGSMAEAISQRVISSTIPETIIVNMRIFTGQEPVTFKIELYVHPSTFDVCLISPEAKEIEDAVVNTAIDNELELISEIACLPIIES